MNTGALGHGLAVAVGMALAAKKTAQPIELTVSWETASKRKVRYGRPPWRDLTIN